MGSPERQKTPEYWMSPVGRSAERWSGE